MRSVNPEDLGLLCEAIEGIDSVEVLEAALSILLERAAVLVGEEEARRMFAGHARPLPVRVRKNFQLYFAYWMMPEPRSIGKLAKRLAEENETVPGRWGPNGSTDPFVMKEQIRRVLKGLKRLPNSPAAHDV
jgi:hypothetical protein